MNDPSNQTLLTTFDALAGWNDAETVDATVALAAAEHRIERAKRLGVAIKPSPYLGYVLRTRPAADLALAAAG